MAESPQDALGDSGLREAESPNLYGCLHHPGLYLYFGLPGLSHLCNPGDQVVNSSLRRVVRRHTKLRAMNHSLQVCNQIVSPLTPLPLSPLQKIRGQIAAEDKLQLGEQIMKALVTRWVSLWLENEKLASWIIRFVFQGTMLPPPPIVSPTQFVAHCHAAHR